MVRDAGFEPACNPCLEAGSTGYDTQIDSQNSGSEPETDLIRSVWPKLPEAIKAAVLAIVGPYHRPAEEIPGCGGAKP